MLDPDVVLSEFVTALRSIPELVTQLGGDPTLISGHYFLTGAEFSLAMAIAKMPSPSILIAYLDLLGGNFDGNMIWKHRLEVYLRPKNAAVGSVGGVGGPRACSAPHLWMLAMNRPVLGGVNHVRAIELIPGLRLMDTPTLTYRQDETLADLFVGQCVFGESGDN